MRRRGRGLTFVLGAADLVGLALALWTSVPVPVNGVALDAGLRPVAGAVARLAANNGFSAQARTDARGRFAVESPRWPVGWTITLSAPGYLPAPSRGGPVVVHRLPWITGAAIDETGAPVAGALVSVGSEGGPVHLVMTDVGGLFQLAGLQPGVQELTAASDSHDAIQRQLALSPDESSQQLVVLARHLATLTIGSDPAGQPVLLDGQADPGCPLTPCQLVVPAGTHTVHIESDLYMPWEQAFTLVKGDTVSAAPTLQRKMGTLVVAAPLGGELTVDLTDVHTMPWSGPVGTGNHTATYRSASTWPATASGHVAWNQATQISLAPTPVVPGDTGAFLAGLQAYLAAAGGQYGVYLEELGTGRTVELGANSSMEAASVIKLPLALYLLHEVDLKQVNLDDAVQLQDQDFLGGTGTLYGNAHSGADFSYGDLLALLIQQSDNTAWQALDRALGSDKVDAYAAAIGAGDCHQANDQCTAREAGHMLAQLARGRLLSPELTTRLLGLLETTAFNDRINYYLGTTTVAHKVGMDGSVMNDAGVVYLQGNAFVISIFTVTPDGDTGVQAIRDISRAAVRLFSR